MICLLTLLTYFTYFVQDKIKVKMCIQEEVLGTIDVREVGRLKEEKRDVLVIYMT